MYLEYPSKNKHLTVGAGTKFGILAKYILSFNQQASANIGEGNSLGLAKIFCLK